jgi:hypothetical protein
MQTEPTTNQNMFQTSGNILRNEKFFGFYKGIFANTIINVPIASMIFFVYGESFRYITKKKFFKKDNINYFIAGCTAGLSTIPFIVPLELIKCNQQINFRGKTKKENRFFSKAHHIWRRSGLLGFYKGFWVTFNRDVFSYGLYFLVFYSINDYYKKHSYDFDAIQQGLVGGLAGMAVWAVNYPFDTVKTIIQTRPIKEKIAQTQLHIFKELYNTGGVREFYRGGSPSLLLSFTFSGFVFVFFELSKKLFVNTYTK